MESPRSFGVSIMPSAELRLLQQQETLGIEMQNMGAVIEREYGGGSLAEACIKCDREEVIREIETSGKLMCNGFFFLLSADQ